ncbi:hypothetical protein T492DRAFT_934267 [Pavlovales sp. CCMP2436]|nr:hypothetical protein T492DRAFT_934267 [Pavlovales sp. CCMP2436]|mmetsp:Transcript_17037/g.43644  ORF Transcript_17037/g.43644 Transcript_17037/m.43644 type:complete len:229 (-) Transcript_17037:545-1231(-)|eukprot:CAMPEP_0179854132 /NCGR_PEP_ID=MMETSP0982-20121206/9749_1 /TAXON_ID=483367 /ORGANISM="non described non described, Strain CCMP 2436" /LENGTH=228 /DNA_ID=CAMNT_0021739955 /DNA_START=99 /DNA_END=785 /DNA_ORIENTATION=-
MAFLAMLAAAAVALHQPALRVSLRQPARVSRVICDARVRDSAILCEGSICEYVDGKGRPALGQVQSSKGESRSAKGVMYDVLGPEGRLAVVPAKAIHIAFPPSATSRALAKPAEVLKDFSAALSCKPAELGFDVDLLGLAWEACLEDDVPSHTAKQIFGQIDAALMEGSVAQYKAYLLLDSDIGHVFFRTLHATDFAHREYKVKTAKEVAAGKELWCKANGVAEFCAV